MTNGLAVSGSMPCRFVIATGQQQNILEESERLNDFKVGQKLSKFHLCHHTCDIKIPMPQQSSELCNVSDFSKDVINTKEQATRLILVHETDIKQHEQRRSNGVVWYVGTSYIACACVCL